ncbi:putative cytokinetic ring protein SteA [Bacillaceae bacterium]
MLAIFPRILRSTQSINGTIVFDRKTKNLLRRILPGQIAVIQHEDIDEVAARGLIEAKVKAIANLSRSMTGSYPTPGPRLLVEANIPIFDLSPVAEISLADGMKMAIQDGAVYVFADSGEWHYVGRAERLTAKKVQELTNLAFRQQEERLRDFIDNTLVYAQKEKEYFLRPLPMPLLRTNMRGKHVVVVVRGSRYKEDLLAIRPYIDDYKPVLIGVDGGADALLEHGLFPDVIVGDMDSVSDRALRMCPDVVVHAYPSGEAPGMERLRRLNVHGHKIPFPGTSEDIAMLLAYEQGAELIVTLGTHSNMIDFLEKGRKGMASTILVRMKIGTRLVDAKGVSILYQRKAKVKNLFYIGLAAGVPVLSISLVSPQIKQMWYILWLQLKMFLT